MTKQRSLFKGNGPCEDSIKAAIKYFLSILPGNGYGLITVPFPKDLSGDTTAKILKSVGLEDLTKGRHKMSLSNGAQLHLCTVSAWESTLQKADVLLTIWPSFQDLERLERVGLWSELVVGGFVEDDWQNWANQYKPNVLWEGKSKFID